MPGHFLKWPSDVAYHFVGARDERSEPQSLTGRHRTALCRQRYGVGAPDVMWSITGENFSVGEKSTYSESSSASGAWPGAQ
jgi:hypothetical protein